MNNIKINKFRLTSSDNNFEENRFDISCEETDNDLDKYKQIILDKISSVIDIKNFNEDITYKIEYISLDYSLAIISCLNKKDINKLYNNFWNEIKEEYEVYGLFFLADMNVPMNFKYNINYKCSLLELLNQLEQVRLDYYRSIGIKLDKGIRRIK